MITLNDIVLALNDIKLTEEQKSEWLTANKVSTLDLIDAVNYVTIGRNFYMRRCETTNFVGVCANCTYVETCTNILPNFTKPNKCGGPFNK